MPPFEPESASAAAATHDIELTAMLCHEISGPLTSLIGRLDLALAELRNASAHGDPGPRMARVSALLNNASGCASQVYEIVRDVRRQARREPSPSFAFELREAVERAVSLMPPSCEIIIEHCIDARVMGSSLRLSQVFANLFANAVAANEDADSAHRSVAVSVRSPDPGWAVVEVTDSGPGISDGVRPYLGLPYFSTRTADPHAMGLGLALSTRFLAAHGGRLEFTTNAGGATTVRAFVPVLDGGAAE